MINKLEFHIIFLILLFSSDYAIPQSTQLNIFKDINKDFFIARSENFGESINKSFLVDRQNLTNKYEIDVFDSVLVKDLSDTYNEKHIYTYEEIVNGKKVTHAHNKRINGEWLTLARETSTYKYEYLSSYLYETKHDSDQLDTIYQINYKYNSEGNRISTISFRWENGKWGNNSRYSYSYDENNNQILSVMQYWHDTFWANNERISRSFDSNNNLTVYVREWWDTNTNEWKGSDRDYFTYYSDGGISSNIEQHYYNNRWNNYERYSYSKDKTLSLYEKVENGYWVYVSQLKYTYDIKSRVTSTKREVWNNGQWINDIQIIYSYYDKENKTIKENFTWDSNEWKLLNRSIYNYNSNGNLIHIFYDDSSDSIDGNTFSVCDNYHCSVFSGKEISLFYKSTSLDREDAVDNKYHLYQNYPNPFNSITKIRFEIPQGGRVTLKVYNTLGQEVAIIINGVEMYPGTYEKTFDASKFNLASGIYLYRLTAGEFNQSNKFIFLK